MRNHKNTLIVIGIILVIVQIVGFIGMSRMYVGLYPTAKMVSSYYRPSKNNSNLTIAKMFFAIQAGLDRFESSFEDLTFPEDEYRSVTVTQMVSSEIREDLGCSKGGSFGLFIYDTILTIAYCFMGILGVVMFVLAKLVDNRYKRWLRAYLEEKRKERHNQNTASQN